MESLCTSLETSRKLKAAKFPQNTALEWVQDAPGGEYYVTPHVDEVIRYQFSELLSAPTAEELADELPAIRLETWHNGHVVAKWHADGVSVKQEHRGQYLVAEADNLAGALAALYLALAEQKKEASNAN